MTYLCWKAEDRQGTISGPGSLVVAETVAEAARSFADGYDTDHFLVVLVDDEGQRWHVNIWTEITYHLDIPEKQP